MAVLIILPTYNERENVGPLLNGILDAAPDAHVLVVDDASPDLTQEIVTARAVIDPRVHLLARAAKEGLGPAYIAGFRWALEREYDIVVGMDADLSHNPCYLPLILERASHYDVVIGSRYVTGGSTPDWSLTRRVISRIGNTVARTVLQLPVRDCTGAYRCYRREALEAIDFSGIDVVGYSFLIELIYQCSLNKLRLGEVPISFTDRRAGASKMTSTIVSEALFYVLRRRWRKERDRVSCVLRLPPATGHTKERNQRVA